MGRCRVVRLALEKYNGQCMMHEVSVEMLIFEAMPAVKTMNLGEWILKQGIVRSCEGEGEGKERGITRYKSIFFYDEINRLIRTSA
jgi:hypothetical protein